MANNIKVVASKDITSTSSSAPTLLHAPTNPKSVLVSAVVLFNTGTSSVDVYLTSKPPSTGLYPVIHKQVSLAAGSGVRLSDLVTLSGQNADSISGYLSVAGSVSCVLFGMERD